jgi:hypothetical protein
VARAGGVPATLVCHSMGTVVAHYFLTNATTPAWRAAHVAGFFAMGPVLGGAETALSRARPRPRAPPRARAPRARCSAPWAACSGPGAAAGLERALSRLCSLKRDPDAVDLCASWPANGHLRIAILTCRDECLESARWSRLFPLLLPALTAATPAARSAAAGRQPGPYAAAADARQHLERGPDVAGWAVPGPAPVRVAVAGAPRAAVPTRACSRRAAAERAAPRARCPPCALSAIQGTVF